MSILVLGTVAYDDLKTPSGLRESVLGGSAVHFSMSARLFSQVCLAAVVGDDFKPSDKKFLESKGLDLRSLMHASGKTFHWCGEYNGDMNTAITHKTELGVLADFNPLICTEQKKTKFVFLANIDPDLQIRLLSQIDSPKLVALDSMNYWINTKRDSLLKALKMVDIFVANDQEARLLSGEINLIKAARALEKCGPKMVLIKKGEHGVSLYRGKEVFSLPSYPIDKVIDPTGAGDTFAGGFMGYLASVKSLSPDNLKRALAYGTVAASFNIEDFGTDRTAMLKRSDLEKRFREFKKTFSF